MPSLYFILEEISLLINCLRNYFIITFSEELSLDLINAVCSQVEYEARKKTEGKKARGDRDQVLEMIFAAFEKHQYYNIKVRPLNHDTKNRTTTACNRDYPTHYIYVPFSRFNNLLS